MKRFNYIFLFSLSIRNFIFTFFLWLNIQAVDFFIEIQQHEIHKKAFVFRKKIKMIERTTKLFLFENDVCFRNKTLINCKQTIIHCEFMLNETIIKIHDMSCETKSSTNETTFFFDLIEWRFHVLVRVFKTINLFKSFKRLKSLKLVTKSLSIFTIHLKFEIFNKNSLHWKIY